jgi:tetratricopeptide (TPR) repeat protein/predicted aspartyl protease
LAKVADWSVRVSAGNKLLIDGAINGQRIDIALDTGAMRSLILRSEALRLGLKPTRAWWAKLSGVGGQTEVEHVTLDEIKIGQTTFEDWHHLFVAGEQDVGGEFALLLGDDFFQQFDIEFDLLHGAVRLFKPSTCTGTSLAYWATDDVGEVAILPFKIDQPRIWVNVQINRKPVRALLDSGAAISLLNKSVAAQLGMTPQTAGVVATSPVGGLGKDVVQAWIAPFKSFVIGNEEIKDTAIPFAELPPDAPMILGADFLSAHRVLVAHSQQKMYFTSTGAPVFQLARYDALIRMNPQQASVFLDRGKALYTKQDYDKALAAYDAALRINPQFADAFVARGMAWRRKGDLDRAVADYDAAIRVNPQQQFAFAERGDVWYERKDYDRAVADYARAIEIDPRLARAYLFRGYAEQQTGNIDAAIADYSQAIAVDPTFAAAHNTLAWQLATSARASVRDGQRAVELALKACELSEWKTSTYIDTLAAAYARNGDYAKAVEWQRKALADDPYVKGKDKALERLRLYEANKAWPPD